MNVRREGSDLVIPGIWMKDKRVPFLIQKTHAQNLIASSKKFNDDSRFKELERGKESLGVYFFSLFQHI